MAKVVFVVTVGATIISRFAFDPRLVPISVSVVGGLIAFFLMGGSRYLWRLFVERTMRPSHDLATPVLIFGAGEAGAQLVTTILRNPESPLVPVGLIDDSPAKQQLRIMGIHVLGTREDIVSVARKQKAEQLIIAIPSAESGLIREISARALEADLKVSVLPQVEELLDDEVRVSDIRPIDVRDLLGRYEIETDLRQIAGYLHDRRVLVTGAGGSIGSELCRQIHRFGPSQLVMLDRDESALHGVELSITGRALLQSENLVVADIRDHARMTEVFRKHEPEVVFHAAALKHLPLLEMHSQEGVKTNVYGTLNVLEAARSVRVERFVNISTDKAADPTSVLGATKRIAERLTAEFAETAVGTYLSVRFGNVLGSRGSVLETFREQIAAGGPLTVTDPQVTRYFMTVEEAVQLVVQAGAVGSDAEALVLDMGEPVKIDDVARRLAAESDRDVEIVYTGLRPGEKLHEDLFADDELDRRPHHPLISHVKVEPLDPELMKPELESFSLLPQ